MPGNRCWGIYRREREMSEEEQKIEGEIEEQRGNGRCVDALRIRSKIVQKGTKKEGQRRKRRGVGRDFK